MRAASALLVLAVLVGISVFPALSPTACNDGCGEEGDAGCVRCPFCASLTPPMLLPAPESPLAEPASPHAPPVIAQRCRTEDRDVFHVPRRLA
jgi:hypothetical protein